MRDTSKRNDAQREYVVERPAAFASPVAIACSLQQEFGIHISGQAIVRYDPTRSAKCPEHWRLLFFATRKGIIEGKAARGAANAIPLTRERLMLRAVEAIADRIIKGRDWLPNWAMGRLGFSRPGKIKTGREAKRNGSALAAIWGHALRDRHLVRRGLRVVGHAAEQVVLHASGCFRFLSPRRRLLTCLAHDPLR